MGRDDGSVSGLEFHTIQIATNFSGRAINHQCDVIPARFDRSVKESVEAPYRPATNVQRSCFDIDV